MDELPVVTALRTLSIFGPNQEGAYREHFAFAAQVLGDDLETRLGQRVSRFASDGNAGLWILTGNAGTGKTAAAEAYCISAGGELPSGDNSDEMREIAPGRWVVKDLSGQADSRARADSLAQAVSAVESGGQALICANEGVLRDALDLLSEAAPHLLPLLEAALRDGAAVGDGTLIVNVNRQRPTSKDLWEQLLDYLSRPGLWDPGCDGCPDDASGCPMRANARAYARPEVRESLRYLFRLGSGEAVPTMREVLAILAWGLVGRDTCEETKRRARDQAAAAFTAEDAYFARILGHGLPLEAVERSPLLAGMRQGALGEVADLQVDEWLRDTTTAPVEIRRLAGAPGSSDAPAGPLAGSQSPHDRVRTAVGTMTFHALGETVSTSEDLNRVEAGLDALVGGRLSSDGLSGGATPRQALWRRRVFFERPQDLGGMGAACGRLLETRYLHDLGELAVAAADGRDLTLPLTELVSGLNFLVCGFSSPDEGLIVPDQSCLFARDPGSFRPALPSLVHAQIPLERLSLGTPDRGLVTELLDIDFIEIDFVVSGTPETTLRLRPRLYEAIREGAAFQGPVGQGIAEMADLRGFYGLLASREQPRQGLRVADPKADPPALIAVRLPHLEAHAP